MWLRGIGILVVIGGLLGAGALLGYGLGFDAGAEAEGAMVMHRHGWAGGGVFFSIFLLFVMFMLIGKFFMFAGWRRHRARAGYFGGGGWRELHERWHREADDKGGEERGEGEKPPTV